MLYPSIFGENLFDDLDNVFIEWVSNGRLTSFSKKNSKSLFDMAG